MFILIILLALIWFICVNAIIADAQEEYEQRKRKFWLMAKDNKPFVTMTGNGEATEEEFYR